MRLRAVYGFADATLSACAYKPRCCGISDRGLWITGNIYKGGEPNADVVRVNPLIAALVDWVRASDTERLR